MAVVCAGTRSDSVEDYLKRSAVFSCGDPRAAALSAESQRTMRASPRRLPNTYARHKRGVAVAEMRRFANASQEHQDRNYKEPQGTVEHMKEKEKRISGDRAQGEVEDRSFAECSSEYLPRGVDLGKSDLGGGT